MKEYRGTRVPMSVINDALDAGEVIELYVGRTQAVRVFLLPAQTWRKAVRVEYASNGRPMYIGSVLPGSTIAAIVQDQVDDKWNPWRYGILEKGGEDAAYLVPANAYWKKRVEEEVGE